MNKIDFVGFISVDHANPNGDPLAGNMPRIDDDSIGEISQNCLRRKIRNRLMDDGQRIFVQSDSDKLDEYTSLAARLKGELDVPSYKTPQELAAAAAEEWLDVRAFGQVMAFNEEKNNTASNGNKRKSKAKKNEEEEDSNEEDEAKNISAHVRGAVSISPAFSVDPVRIESLQITKSVSGSEADGEKGSDTMGMTHRVQYGLYRFHGSISPKLAAKNGLSEEDAANVLEAMRTMFVDDQSTARPVGSMEMTKIVTILHSSELGDASTAAINRAVKTNLKDGVDTPRSIEDYEINVDALKDIEGIEYEVVAGL